MDSSQEYIAYGSLHYKVMERGGKWCARYRVDDKLTWYRSSHVLSKNSAEAAQSDLDRIAQERGWKKI